MSTTALIHLRPEEPEDAPAIRAIHRLAFGREEQAALVDTLRSVQAGVLSMVAVDADGRPVAHVLYTWVTVDQENGEHMSVLGLAPLAVLPTEQGRGIATRLVEASLERLRAEGHTAVVVVGDPRFYSRFGFLPGSRWGLRGEANAPGEAFMVVELSAGALAGVRGMVRFRPEFAGV